MIIQKELAKKGLSFSQYDKQIRTIEKDVLVKAIQLVLEGK